MLKTGDRAPDFVLDGTHGAVSLAGLRGKKTVLYFYPKDNTPGCTQEACDFRDTLARIRAAGADVMGVSKDSVGSHQKFKEKYALPFPLLSDPDNAIAKRFGVYGKKVLYGKEIMGTIRSTFVIDEQGKVVAMWSPVKVAGHVEQVLAALTGQAPAVVAAPARKVAPKKKKAGVKKPSSPEKRIVRRS